MMRVRSCGPLRTTCRRGCPWRRCPATCSARDLRRRPWSGRRGAHARRSPSPGTSRRPGKASPKRPSPTAGDRSPSWPTRRAVRTVKGIAAMRTPMPRSIPPPGPGRSTSPGARARCASRGRPSTRRRSCSPPRWPRSPRPRRRTARGCRCGWSRTGRSPMPSSKASCSRARRILGALPPGCGCPRTGRPSSVFRTRTSV